MIASCQQNDQCVRADRYAERNFSYGEKCGEDAQQATRGFTAEQCETRGDGKKAGNEGPHDCE